MLAKKNTPKDLTFMSNSTQTLQVRVLGQNDKQTLGEVTFQTWDQKTRLKRAGKSLMTGLGFTIVAVFIPGVHFILVPLLFLGSPIFSYFVYHQESAILGGSSLCPGCSKEFKIVKSKDIWPLKDICAFCQENVTIEKVAG